jgi:uncharacterized protein YndB with AHSA1/START domain
METPSRTIGLEQPLELQTTMTRFFAAPRETVFRMMIDPLLIPRWWGPVRARTEVDSMDVEPGGEWRFVQYDDDGEEYGFHGVYQEVKFPERLSYSLQYEGTSGEDRTETVTLTEDEGRTRLTLMDAFDSARARDDAMASGLLEGFAAGMDRLAALLGEGEEKVE